MNRSITAISFRFKYFIIIIFCLLSTAAFSQGTITGRVTDSTNAQGLPGINVLVKGSSRGTITDANGNFSIAASPGDVLVLSAVNFQTQEVVVGNSGTINIALFSRNSQLSEVVVIGYGVRQKKDLTGAISVIATRDIEKSTALSPELAMQGQMAGVNVISAGGNPTARPTVRVRGVTSLNYSDPLYVIDGVPLVEGGAGAVVDPVNDPTRRGPINLYSIINPNDIETMTVLKDASAAAVYGVRAANGVILITTKTGKRGRVRVDFDANYGIQKVPETYDVLDTKQYVKFYTDAYNAFPDLTGNTPIPIENAAFFGPLWSPSNPGYIGNRPTYDWQNAVINSDSKIQNYNVRASGASENTTYNFSAGYSNNDGPFIGYNAERYSISTNVSSRIGKYFEAGINIRGIQQSTKNPGGGITLDVYKAAPWQPIYDQNGPLGFAPLWGLNAPITPSTFDKTTLYGVQYVAYSNVLGELATAEERAENKTGIGSGYFQVNPIAGLKIRGTLSGQLVSIDSRSWRSFDNWWFGENPESPFTGVASPVAGTRPGFVSFGNSTTTSMTKAVNLDYLKTFGAHTLNLTLDASEQTYKWTGTGAQRSILSEDPTLRYFSVSGQERAYYELRGAYALIGYFGRVSYNYNNRYYIDALVRRDGSSRFAPGNKWGTFPSASVAWRISDENFMRNLTFLNDLKIRAGYGMLGNEQTSSGWKYLSIAGVVPPSYGLGNPTTNNRGIAFTTFPNEPLTWEKIYSANIGFDALMFNNKVTLTVDYYNRRTKGIIQSVALAPTTGFSGLADLNIAEVLNRGFEFQAGYNETFGKFGLSLNANLTTVHNEVLSLLNNTALRGAGLEVGYPIGFIHGYKVGGIFQSEDEIAKYRLSTRDVNSTQQKPGDIWFQNLYGPPSPGSTDRNTEIDSVVNNNDQTYLGSTIPGYYYGFTASANFAGFDLSIFFQGRGDVQKFNSVRLGGEAMNGYGRNVFSSVLNAWTPSNPSNTMPRAVYGDPNANTRFSDRFVENAGYLRLQNLQLGYTIPASVIRATGGAVQNVRVFVSGINLFTITDYSGLDPENDLYPSTRQLLFGIKASF